MTDSEYQRLIDELVRSGYLKTPEIVAAFRKFPRKYFVTNDYKEYANYNDALPIGQNQTISQPLTVAFMLELLQPKEGDKILEIGAGSGWQTAILGEIVGRKGRVYAFEIIKRIAEFGKSNLSKFKQGNIQYIYGDATHASKGNEPYDRIISGAAFKMINDELKSQLKILGRLVVPTQDNYIVLVERISKNNYNSSLYYGFSFVPITTKLR